MGNNDGKVIIQVDTNADSAAKKMEQLNTAAKQQKQGLNLAKAALNAHNAEMKYLGKTSESMKAKQAILNEQFKKAQMQYANTRLELTKYETAQKQIISNSAQTQSALNNTTNSLFSLKGAAVLATAAFAAMKLKDFSVDVLTIAGSFEQLNIAFQTLAGKQAGSQLVQELINLSAVTPMTAESLSKNARLLLVMGESIENIIPDLKMLGDISGGSEERMQSLSLVFAQIGSRGRLTGDNLRQIAEQGFDPLNVIAQKTGETMSEVRDRMEKGNVSFTEFKEALRSATSEGGRFFGMMNAQSKTLQGELTKLSNKWNLVGKSIGDFFLPAAKAAVIALTRLGDATLRLTQLNQTYNASIPNQGLDNLKLRLSEVHRMQEKWNNAIKNAPNIATRGLMVANYTKELQKLNIQEKQIEARINTLSKKSSTETKVTSGFANSTSIDFGGQVARSRKQASTIVKQTVQEEINAYDQLQNKVSQLKENLYIMSTQGKNSGDIWTKSLENYRLAQTQLDAVNKSIENNAVVALGSYDQLNNKINEMRVNLQNMAVSGQAGTPAFDKLKNDYVEATNQMKDANRQVTNAMGLDWENIGRSISSDLSSALTTPLQEGENAFQRFGNVALNTISMIGQALIQELAISPLIDAVSGSGFGKTISGFFGGLFGSANGNVFQNGNPVKAFASGGVVSSPTLFPMANGGTGLMGEAGAEAIMPLKRGSNGKLGVQASGSGGNIYINNNFDRAQIETTKRPNGDTEIRIREINNALANERTQQGLSVGMSRQNSRGVTAA